MMCVYIFMFTWPYECRYSWMKRMVKMVDPLVLGLQMDWAA